MRNFFLNLEQYNPDPTPAQALVKVNRHNPIFKANEADEYKISVNRFTVPNSHVELIKLNDDDYIQCRLFGERGNGYVTRTLQPGSTFFSSVVLDTSVPVYTRETFLYLLNSALAEAYTTIGGNVTYGNGLTQQTLGTILYSLGGGLFSANLPVTDQGLGLHSVNFTTYNVPANNFQPLISHMQITLTPKLVNGSPVIPNTGSLGIQVSIEHTRTDNTTVDNCVIFSGMIETAEVTATSSWLFSSDCHIKGKSKLGSSYFGAWQDAAITLFRHSVDASTGTPWKLKIMLYSSTFPSSVTDYFVANVTVYRTPFEYKDNNPSNTLQSASQIAPYFTFSADTEKFILNYHATATRDRLQIGLSKRLSDIIEFDTRSQPDTATLNRGTTPFQVIQLDPQISALNAADLVTDPFKYIVPQPQRRNTAFKIQQCKILQFLTDFFPVPQEIGSGTQDLSRIVTDFIIPSYTSSGYFNFSVVLKRFYKLTANFTEYDVKIFIKYNDGTTSPLHIGPYEMMSVKLEVEPQ